MQKLNDKARFFHATNDHCQDNYIYLTLSRDLLLRFTFARVIVLGKSRSEIPSRRRSQSTIVVIYSITTNFQRYCNQRNCRFYIQPRPRQCRTFRYRSKPTTTTASRLLESREINRRGGVMECIVLHDRIDDRT